MSIGFAPLLRKTAQSHGNGSKHQLPDLSTARLVNRIIGLTAGSLCRRVRVPVSNPDRRNCRKRQCPSYITPGGPVTTMLMRPMQRRFGAILGIPVLLTAIACAATAQDASVTGSDEGKAHQELVEKLGHPSFEVREFAAQRLQEIGLPARPALMNALKSADLETRMGAHRVLVHIMQEDFDAQLQAFVEGKDGDGLHLPGWELFSRLVGDTAEARRLYAEMIRHEPELLEKLDDLSGQAEPLRRLYEQRVQLLSNASRVGRSHHLTIPCVATLLLVSQQPEVKSTSAESRLYAFLVEPSIKREIMGGAHFSIVQKILAKWVSSGNSQHYALRIALAYELESAGKELARGILTADTPSGTAVAYAAMVMARFGDSADLRLLLPHLTNSTVFHSWHNAQLKKEPIRIQVRDAVLAMSIRLTGQQPPDYGFKLLRSDEDTIYKVYTLGFLEDAERDAAFQKWRTWFEAHPDRSPPLERNP
jgi:hypothetical protein